MRLLTALIGGKLMGGRTASQNANEASVARLVCGINPRARPAAQKVLPQLMTRRRELAATRSSAALVHPVSSLSHPLFLGVLGVIPFSLMTNLDNHAIPVIIPQAPISAPGRM